MSAPIWNIILEEGSDFDLVLVYKSGCTVVDITGYGARFAIRNDPDESALLVSSITGGQITVAGTTGQFTLLVGATTVDTLKNLIDASKAKYAFTIWPSANTPDVNPRRLLQGSVKFSRNYGGA